MRPPPALPVLVSPPRSITAPASPAAHPPRKTNRSALLSVCLSLFLSLSLSLSLPPCLLSFFSVSVSSSFFSLSLSISVSSVSVSHLQPEESEHFSSCVFSGLFPLLFFSLSLLSLSHAFSSLLINHVAKKMSRSFFHFFPLSLSVWLAFPSLSR